jgi:beta-xylosidase
MLTQRTIGPKCEGETRIDVSAMKDGDVAGLILLQSKYGYTGVKFENGKKYIVMVNTGSGVPVEVERIPLKGQKVYFKAACDFTSKRDIADFYYSLNGKKWNKIGSPLKMEYTLSHFMGYRYGLFNSATKTAGGHVDFDYFNINYTN